MPLLTACS